MDWGKGHAFERASPVAVLGASGGHQDGCNAGQDCGRDHQRPDSDFVDEKARDDVGDGSDDDHGDESDRGQEGREMLDILKAAQKRSIISTTNPPKD